MNKKMTAIGLTAGLLAGLGAGLVLEMSGDAGASSTALVAADTTQTTAPDATGSGSVGDSANDADRTTHLQSVLQPLVDDGTLTQAQADKVIAALVAADPMGHGGMGDGDGDGRGPGGRGMFGGLDSVATLLGMTTDEIATELQSGTTLATLATEHGSTAQDVIDVMVQAVKDHFTPEVAAGEHTQAEADAMIAAATTQITDFVNNGGGMGPMGGGRGDHDRDGGRGHDGDGGQDDESGDSGTGGAIDGGPSDDTQTSTGA